MATICVGAVPGFDGVKGYGAERRRRDLVELAGAMG